jgi:hypothetical protein
MSNVDGNTVSGHPVDKDLTAAIAQSMLSSLIGKVPEPVSARAPADQQSLAVFATRLDELVSSSPELRRAVEETMSRSARQALAFGDGPLPSMAEFVDSLHHAPVVGKGGTTVRGDWWGFQIMVSHEDLDVFLATAVPLSAITATLVAGLWPPAAPFIAIAAAFIAGALALLKSLDRGRGVCISMSWFAAGVFVPTTV